MIDHFFQCSIDRRTTTQEQTGSDRH